MYAKLSYVGSDADGEPPLTASRLVPQQSPSGIPQSRHSHSVS